MMLSDITARVGARKRRKRVGRGDGSGHGKTCGRGHKGAQARSGCDIRPLTEGGQMPLFRRLPKRGFSNVRFRRAFSIVNVGTLNDRFSDGDTVDPETLRKLRLGQDADRPVRILGKGTLSKRLTVHAHAFSARAKQAIEQAGGRAELIELKSAAEKAAAKRRTAGARTKGKPGKDVSARQTQAET